MNVKDFKIGILGLGYVGLPLAVAFAQKYNVIGFDINKERVDELNNYNDSTLEIDNVLLKSVLNRNSGKPGLNLTALESDLKNCNFYIITVPTPIDKFNRPVLTPLENATKTVAALMNEGNIVVYESTVYPGVIEDKMVPIIEKISKLVYNEEFYCGYSPERINPGDKEHTITKILKVTSGSTPQIADLIDNLYGSVITAGTFKAPSIRVAEAAKVIENCQRDINIAFVNELSKIFNHIGIDTYEVLKVASTKWNFLNFKPGLVGGHCISVDPYYLAQKAQEIGYHPEIILAGRRLNDSMGVHVAKEVIKLMIRKGLKVSSSKALILGFTFKEDCPDTRNTQVIDILNELISYHMKVDVHDPWVNPKEVSTEYNIDILTKKPNLSNYSAIILCVAHKKFLEIDISTNNNCVVFDVKGMLSKENVDARL